jgi:outer membrane protein TolC
MRHSSTVTAAKRSRGNRKYKAVTLVLTAFFASHLLNAQSLQELLRQAEANNPKIQAYELRYSIAGEKANEASTLPDTEFGAGLFVSEPETRTGAQKARFSIRQMLPWFGTITARENYANAMAEAEFEELALMRRQLALEVSRGVYELYANKEQQRVLEENTVLLETYEKQALTMVEVGKASVVDVLRIQIRQNELLERIQVLEQQYQAREAALNNLLNRDARTEIIISETLEIPGEEPGSANDSLSMHPELLKYDRLYESVKQAEVLNQKESAPNLGVGVDYVPVQERAGMTFGDNGKDILMPMVSLTVPIFNRTYTSRTRQNALKQQELDAMRKDRENDLRSRLELAVAARNVARIQYETLSANLDQARNAEQILVRNYETGTIDFNDVLDIQELQLNFRMKRIEAVRSYYSQAAMINYISGV